jgi:hypothetical protein
MKTPVAACPSLEREMGKLMMKTLELWRPRVRHLIVAKLAQEFLRVGILEHAGYIAGTPLAAVGLDDLLSADRIFADADGSAFGDFGRDAETVQFLGDSFVGIATATPLIHLENPTLFLRAGFQSHDFFLCLGVEAAGADSDLPIREGAAEFPIGALLGHAIPDALDDYIPLEFREHGEHLEEQFAHELSHCGVVHRQWQIAEDGR